jgi:hypothetical protein
MDAAELKAVATSAAMEAGAAKTMANNATIEASDANSKATEARNLAMQDGAVQYFQQAQAPSQPQVQGFDQDAYDDLLKRVNYTMDAINTLSQAFEEKLNAVETYTNNCYMDLRQELSKFRGEPPMYSNGPGSVDDMAVGGQMETNQKVRELEVELRKLEEVTFSIAQLEARIAQHEGIGTDLVQKIKLQEAQLNNASLLGGQGMRSGGNEFMIGDQVIWRGKNPEVDADGNMVLADENVEETAPWFVDGQKQTGKKRQRTILDQRNNWSCQELCQIERRRCTDSSQFPKWRS